MATLILPPRLARFTEGWRIDGASTLGAPSIKNNRQAVANPGAPWVAKLSLHCEDEDDYIEADGFLAGLDGSANAIVCGPEDWRGRPWNIDPLTVRPWLRLDYPTGTAVEFAKPVGLMRLTPDSAAMVERTTSPLSDLSLDLVEYL
jgi:hypothetical protein